MKSCFFDVPDRNESCFIFYGRCDEHFFSELFGIGKRVPARTGVNEPASLLFSIFIEVGELFGKIMNAAFEIFVLYSNMISGNSNTGIDVHLLYIIEYHHVTSFIYLS